MRRLLAVLFISLMSLCAAMAQSSGSTQKPGDPSTPKVTPRPTGQNTPDEDNRPPRTAGPRTNDQSSSKDTIIDLSPPPNDAKDHPESSTDPDFGITEFHAYNPMKAIKNTEVGDYYFSQKNYGAAASRYREALQWKPNDAIATFRLAQSLEKLGQFTEARQSYKDYLKILPRGEYAAKSKEALQRLKDKPDQPNSAKGQIPELRQPPKL